jgi:hypothetical protein
MAERPLPKPPAPSDQWIVLIEKVPRGPLSQSDIELLIERGVVRRNDLAMQVASIDGKHESAWKFIWQYTPFDRRRNQTATPAANAKPPAPQPERRKMVDPKTLSEPPKVTELPDEILNITPEELILKARPAPTSHREESVDDASPPVRKEPVTYSSNPGGRGSGRWAFALSSVLGIVAISFLFFPKKRADLGSFTTTPPKVADPVSQGGLSTGGPLSGTVQPMKRQLTGGPAAPPPPAMPAPRIRDNASSANPLDNGVIPETAPPEGFDDPEMLEQQAEEAEAARAKPAIKRRMAPSLPAAQGDNPLRVRRVPSQNDEEDPDFQEVPPWAEDGND